ncbi:hypothetical protein EUX98_g8159 [Antrodiella citrinella]|uniref:t-SNARE coiled-coil homology domain-containing protein n=1 Tax=Antrodiella citrinella TaxID=2447956 RepID=A0A4V3XGS5_9APHY|nr:hypothetical protein EUX98_g8159 [Antrodiella citrinella]
MATLAKLTSQSTQTLSLLLERQRLQTLSAGPNNLHLPQIARNLKALRTGILALEASAGSSSSNGSSGNASQGEAVRLLKSQYERMRGMLGGEAEVAGVESLSPAPALHTHDDPSSAASSSSSLVRATPPNPPPTYKDHDGHGHSPSPDPSGPFAPYTDDPEAGYTSADPPPSDATLLLAQRQLMDSQDVHLDSLSRSITRQHGLSLQINDELDVHAGLLEGLDGEVDRTEGRLGGARRRLERVVRGAKENGSTFMIGLLIFVLLILIIVFKT